MPRRTNKKNAITKLADRRQENRETLVANATTLFQSYYQAQPDLLAAEEWDVFMTCLKSELPATFRVTGFRGHTLVLLNILRNQASVNELPDSPDPVPVPKPLPWYPRGLAWQLDVSRSQLRKVLELRQLHRFLVSETESGYLSRQEAVSMIPPLVLDLKYDSNVLDMCAAPGSKTTQIVEALHESAVAAGLSEPTGCVIANDVDNKRAYLMHHQVKRVQSSCVAVVNQDATIFPALVNNDGTDFMFDRILVDAPCSGDGTLRKNPGIWDRWKPGLGINEHFIQCRILRRGLELLQVGGRLVYSTCSLNPVENEAVVWKALTDAGSKALRLVDPRHLLPGLKSRPGLTHWKVVDKQGVFYSSYSEVPNERSYHGYLRSSMFPSESKLVDEGRSTDELRVCLRIMPHDQNSGGFFVAVFEKTAHLPWTRAAKGDTIEKESNGTDKEGEPPNKAVKLADSEISESVATLEVEDGHPPMTSLQIPQWKKRRQRKTCIYNEEPFFFMTAEDKAYLQIKDFYGLTDALDPTLLMYRCEGGKRRNLYYTSQQLKRLLQSNGNIKWINLGVKMFSVCEDNDYHGYRLLQEGLELGEGLVRTRRMALCRNDTRLLLTHVIPFAEQLCSKCLAEWSRWSVGPLVLDFLPMSPDNITDEDCHKPNVAVHFAGWRGGTTLRCYLKRHERDHLLRLIGDVPPDDLVSTEDDRATHLSLPKSIALGNLSRESVDKLVERTSDCENTASCVE